eukprot:m.28001 g.28001  ORF g.28001 m.28001 type:complete len:61 (+) comp9004_c0_seq1:1414-1596(+)
MASSPSVCSFQTHSNSKAQSLYTLHYHPHNAIKLSLYIPRKLAHTQVCHLARMELARLHL